MNLKLIYVACSLYSGPRCLAFMDAISSVFKANGTVLAGCSLAASLVKVLLYRLMVSIADKFPA
eukprot:8883851-Pyramimonas_sp.AAC.1